MLRQRYLLSVFFICFGILFFAPIIKLSLLTPFIDWRGVTLILGIAFLFQAYLGKDNYLIFPGFLLTSIPLLFIYKHFDPSWIIDWPKFILVIGIGYLFQNYKQKITTLPPILLIVISLFSIFYNKNQFFTISVSGQVSNIFTYWPLAFLIIGLVLIFKKR